MSDRVPIQVHLPFHLRTLSNTANPLTLQVPTPVTLQSVLDELEHQYPMLRGTIREHATHRRRPYLRFFAAQQDISHHSPDLPLPATVTNGTEPLTILGSVAGG